MKKESKSSLWVKLLRIAAYVSIVLGCLVSVVLGGLMIASARTYGPANVVIGLLVILVGVILTFVGSSAIMIFLDMANDLRAIRKNTENH